jgi:hypothetical protein
MLFLLKRKVVAEAHGIRLVSFGRQSEFVPIISQALELICRHDLRRFGRVQAHLDWIFDNAHWAGAGHASYHAGIKACRIDFGLLPAVGDPLSQAAGYAGLIVHEATHGVLEARQICAPEYDRGRLESLCYSEQNRFLARLKAQRPELRLFKAKYRPEFYASLGKQRFRHLATELCRLARRRAPNPQGGANRRQPFSSEPNRTSAAAASRRSP